MPRNPIIKFNEVQMFFGEPYVIDTDDSVGSITITLPSVGDIVRIGDDVFFQNLNCFITNTTQYRLMLWENGEDWNVISDFQLFVVLYRYLDFNVTKLMFGDLDFSKFEPMYKFNPDEEIPSDKYIDIGEKEDGTPREIILWNSEAQVEINQNVHNHISQYLRTAFGIFPEEKITNSPTLKEWYIRKDKNALTNKEKQNKEEKSSFLRVISACLNYPGFKYNSKELKTLCISEFYDSFQQIQFQIQKEAFIHGLYGGFMDTKNVKPESLSIIRN